MFSVDLEQQPSATGDVLNKRMPPNSPPITCCSTEPIVHLPLALQAPTKTLLRKVSTADKSYTDLQNLTEAESKRRNPSSFIFTGYRTEHTIFDCFKSVFLIHNETLNIWTHLLAFFYWSYVFSTLHEREWFNNADELSQAITKAGYGICLLMPLSSALYHTFCDAQTCCCFHAGPAKDAWSVANVFLRLDLFGIYSLFYARSLMEGYLAMYCHRSHWILYQMCSLLTFAVLAPIGLWTTHLWPMVPSFILVHVPILVILFMEDWWNDSALFFHVFFSLMGTLCFVFAFAIYRRRWPESKWPGQFDIIGQSHQIWHFLTWLGPELIMIGMRYHFERLGRGKLCL
jgi:predicted membrane channel-forming protein YqfA (hemolysin III family)